MNSSNIGIVGVDGTKLNKLQSYRISVKILEIFIQHASKLIEDNKIPYTKNILEDALKELTLVSGGCHKGGVDIIAEDVADSLNVKKKIFPAEVYKWNDIGCCLGCKVHHDLELDLERIIGKCTCPCHKSKNWQPQLQRIKLKGYRSRNIQVAEESDILYCFDLKGKWSGATWTYNYAKKLGKEVHMIEIE